MKQTTQKVDYAFLKSKLFSGFNTWAQREIDFDAQSTNMSRLSDSVFSFIEYNYLPSCETDILDGHYTFFVNKDTFEYLVYKSSDYGSLSYVLPVDFDGFLTAELLPEPSKLRVESVIASKLLGAYFYDADARFRKGKNLFTEVENSDDYHYIYSKRSLISDNRGYIWCEFKPETYSDIELQALNKLCGFVPPDINEFDTEFIQSFIKGFKIDKTRVMEWNGKKIDIKYNTLNILDKDYTVFYYVKPYGNYKVYSLIEGTPDNVVKVISNTSDTLPLSNFINIIPQILRNIAN